MTATKHPCSRGIKASMPKSSVSTAQKSYGEALPAWVHTLAEACDQKSQKKISDGLKYSPAVINTVLSNTYKGDLKSVQQAVEGLLMSAVVDCPVMGEMKSNVCLQHQKREFKATNHIRVRLHKACRSGCQHSRIGDQS